MLMQVAPPPALVIAILTQSAWQAARNHAYIL
jgi:hypothetical protein